MAGLAWPSLEVSHAMQVPLGRVGLGIPDDDEGTRGEGDARLDVIEMRVGESVAVTRW